MFSIELELISVVTNRKGGNQALSIIIRGRYIFNGFYTKSNKIILNSDELISDSFRLGMQIIKSGFIPTMILVLWRGGAIIGMAIHELMIYKKFQLNHMILKASSYQNTQRQDVVSIEGLESVLRNLKKDEKVLIVDDIFDSGKTMSSLVAMIKEHRKEENDQYKINHRIMHRYQIMR